MNTALNRTTTIILTNVSGGLVLEGDVVILITGTASAFTTTTTAAYVDGLIGVVLEPAGIANGVQGRIAVGGFCPKINLSSAASAGYLLKTHSVAKQAAPHASPFIAGDFGIALGAGTTPEAVLFGFVNQGGSSSSTLFLDSITLDPTYGDHFTSSVLDAKWTRHNLTSSDDVRQSANGSWLRTSFTNGSADESYLQTAPAGDWEIQMKIARVSGITNSMHGLIAVDSSGNGVALVFYNDDFVYLMTLVSYAYNATGSHIPLATGHSAQYGATVWLSLIKSGTNYTGRISNDGVNWSALAGPDSHVNTIDKFGFGRIFNAATNEIDVIDWFNKI